MMSKVNVPKSTLLIIVLLAVAILAYKSFEGQTTSRKQLKQRNTSSSYKYVQQIVNPSVINKERSEHSIRVTVVKNVPKPTKPVIRKFNLLWRKKGNVFYREIMPNVKPKLDILLLHGRKYNSTTWVHLKTMDILAASGFHVVAMDLPGYGDSHFDLSDESDKLLEKFLGKFIKKAGLVAPVIVAPSESGKYALPYIVGLNKVSGFVPIAAVASDRFPLKDFKHFKAPTLIIRGSKDLSLGKMSMDTLHQAIRHSETEIIQDAGHACYIHKPNEFHAALLKFLKGILKDKVN